MLQIHTIQHGNATETFVWRWTDKTRNDLLKFIGLFASSKMTTFSYDDAAFVSEYIRNTAQSSESQGMNTPITR